MRSRSIRAMNAIFAFTLAAGLYVSASTADAPTGGWVGGSVGPAFEGTGEWRPATQHDETVRWGR